MCEDFKQRGGSRIYKRTTQEQLEIYVGFLDNNPDFKTGKICPNDPQYMQMKWSELALKLNSLKGPTRTPNEWKASLAHWKNQLKSRARKNKCERMLTGGGPTVEDCFNNLDERALNTFGKVSVLGEEETLVLGFEEAESSTNLPPITTNEDSFSYEYARDTSGSLGHVADTSTLLAHVGDSSTSSAKPKKNVRKCDTSDVVHKISKLLDEKEEREKKTEERRLRIEEKLADGLLKLGEGFSIMAKALEKLCENK